MPAKEYRHGTVVVTYDADVCIHAAECVRGLPQVFNPDARPWIRLDQASPEDVQAVVRKCPSGALTFRKDAPAMTTPPTPAVKATVMKNGPVVLEGACCVVDVDGKVLKEATRVALCRCGASAKKPFCDGSHARVGFTAD